MTGNPRQITVQNRLEELARIHEDLERFALETDLPETPRRALLLVVEELFTNTVHYGYAEGAADGIVITVEHAGDVLKLVIRDHGKAFDVGGDPTTPDDGVPLEDMQIGGLGLFLVHELATSVSNRRDGRTNVTEVLLPIEAA